MDDPPYFTVGGTEAAPEFQPAPHARSWWTADMMHGRLLGGLMARAIEHDNDDPELQVSRMTVDMFRNAPLKPARVELERVRDGRRIRVMEVTSYVADQPVARATAVLLRRTEQPAGRVPATPQWDAPPPDQLPVAHSRFPPRAWRFDEHNDPARHWSAVGKRRIWMQETCQLVAGEPLTPLIRATLAGDSASPLAHASDVGLEFINADYTLYLSRMPVGQTIGLESGGHTSAEGVAVGHCTMFDGQGPIGYCMTAAVANPGVRPPRRTHTGNHATS